VLVFLFLHCLVAGLREFSPTAVLVVVAGKKSRALGRHHGIEFLAVKKDPYATGGLAAAKHSPSTRFLLTRMVRQRLTHLLQQDNMSLLIQYDAQTPHMDLGNETRA